MQAEIFRNSSDAHYEAKYKGLFRSM